MDVEGLLYHLELFWLYFESIDLSCPLCRDLVVIVIGPLVIVINRVAVRERPLEGYHVPVHGLRGIELHHGGTAVRHHIGGLVLILFEVHLLGFSLFFRQRADTSSASPR